MDYVLVKNGMMPVGTQMEVRDLLIGNNKILLIEDSIPRPEPETPVIDAKGKVLMPGAVDMNVMFSDLGTEEGDALHRLSQAELLCGTTTFLEPLFPHDSFDYKEELAFNKNRRFKLRADYGFHLSLQQWNTFGGNEMQFSCSHEGVSSYYLQWPLRSESEVQRVENLMSTAAKNDLSVLVELQPFYSTKQGVTGLPLGEEGIDKHMLHLRSILDLSLKTQCRICLLNIGYMEELEMVKGYLSAGFVSVELMMPYHIGGADPVSGKRSSSYVFSIDNKLTIINDYEFWDLLKQDEFMVARPMLHLSGRGVVKGSQVDNRPDDYFLLKHFLSVVYSAGVVTGKLNFNDFIDLTSTRIAKNMGLYPQKGFIQIGSDADLVIWNPDFQRNLYCSLPDRKGDMEQNFRLEGRVEFVFVQGRMAYNGESFSAEKTWGRYLYRSPYERSGD